MPSITLAPQPPAPHPQPQLRLGCGPGLYGRPGLRCYDAGGGGRAAHLSVSLAYVRDGLAWCAQAGIHLLRLHARLAPDPPEVGLAQVGECAAELAHVGGLAWAAGVRLTFHAPLGAALGVADAATATRAGQRLAVLAGLLDGLGADQGVIVAHVGGEGAAAQARWAARVMDLAPAVRRRLALEPDLAHTTPHVVELAVQSGTPVVFDVLHHRLRPAGWSVRAALAACLATWPPGVRPKVHLSSPRTEARLMRRRGGLEARLPRPEEHADLIHPFECVDFLDQSAGLPAFDLFLEARAADVALLRLREDLRRYAPDWADRLY